VLREEKDRKGQVRTRAHLKKQQRANKSLVDTEKVRNGRGLVIVLPKGTVWIERGLNWIAVLHVVLIKKRVDVHGLVYPQFAVDEVALELYTQEYLHRPTSGKTPFAYLQS
jgi:hypothetical protein